MNDLGRGQGWGLVTVVAVIAAGWWWHLDQEPVIVAAPDSDTPAVAGAAVAPAGVAPAGVAKITVTVEGDVAAPGRYRTTPGLTLAEVLRIAGGARASARLDDLNSYQVIVSDTAIYIPSRLGDARFSGDKPVILTNRDLIHVGVRSGAAPVRSRFAAPRVNINTAPAAELITLPRIGEKTAASIIAYRDAHGRFRSLEELQNVPRIGEKTFAELREKITL